MRTMERCQGKPGCENPADRDGCEETRECEKSKRQKATGIGGKGKLGWGVAVGPGSSNSEDRAR